MPVAVLFPGQGAQYPGMLGDLPPGVGPEVLAEACDVLGAHAPDLDPAGDPASTERTQLSLLITEVAWYRAVTAEGLSADAVAGHSIGLWSAAVAAGSLAFGDAVGLVRLRARAMAACTPPRSGMVAVVGLREHAVERLCADVRARGGRVWLSTANTGQQFAVSGVDPDLDELGRAAARAGATRVRRLAVTVASHCPLMADARAAVERALDRVELRRPEIPVGGNVSGQTVFTAQALRRELALGVEVPVRWSQSVHILAERGVRTWWQTPPGHVLARLTGDILPGVHAVDTTGGSAAEAAERVVRESERGPA